MRLRWAAIGPRVGMLVSRVSALQESPTADGGVNVNVITPSSGDSGAGSTCGVWGEGMFVCLSEDGSVRQSVGFAVCGYLVGSGGCFWC